MDLNLTPKQKMLQKKCRDFAQREIYRYVSQLETDPEYRNGLYQKMSREGLFTLLISPELEGNTLGYYLGLSEISQADAGIAVGMAVTNMVAEMIQLHGTPEQQTKYIKLLKEGTAPAAFALTEKQAGSDVRNIQTKAVQDFNNPEIYVIDGEKQLISNADIAGFIVLIAKTEDESTAFLIDRNTPGVEVTKKEQKIGLLTANLVNLRFRNCKIPESQILGKAGKGLSMALSALDSGRIGIAAQSIGIAQAAYEAALHYAKTHEAFGEPIGKFQAIAFKLADMHVKLSAMRQLLLQACWAKAQKKEYTLEASTAKLFCSEACNEIASEALQIHGGYGYIKGYPVEKYWRDARATTIYEGTSEIQRIVISRHLLT